MDGAIIPLQGILHGRHSWLASSGLQPWHLLIHWKAGLSMGCSRQWQDSVGNWSWVTSPQHKCPLVLSSIPLASSLSAWPRLFRNSCVEWSSYPNPTPLWMRRDSWSLVSWGSLSEHRTTRAAILQHGRKRLGKQREEESYVSRVVFTAWVRRNGLKWKQTSYVCPDHSK